MLIHRYFFSSKMFIGRYTFLWIVCEGQGWGGSFYMFRKSGNRVYLFFMTNLLFWWLVYLCIPTVALSISTVFSSKVLFCAYGPNPKKTWQFLWLICTLSFWLGSFLSHKNIHYYISSTSFSYFWWQSPMNLFPIIGSISLSNCNEKALMNWLVV